MGLLLRLGRIAMTIYYVIARRRYDDEAIPLFAHKRMQHTIT